MAFRGEEISFRAFHGQTSTVIWCRLGKYQLNQLYIGFWPKNTSHQNLVCLGLCLVKPMPVCAMIELDVVSVSIRLGGLTPTGGSVEPRSMGAGAAGSEISIEKNYHGTYPLSLAEESK
ncbi:hypothetical protein [Pseudomonas palleroniana]